MSLDREFSLEIYDRRILSRFVYMVVDKQKYSRRNELFNMIHTF